MIIVCTQDKDVAANKNGAGAWGTFRILPAGKQPAATTAFAAAIANLGKNEPLALSAHGNNDELGDAHDGWGWSFREVAELLLTNAPREYTGPILIHACATRVVNFSANLAVALEKSRLEGIWIYGYNRAVGSSESYPDPQKLDKNVSLQGTQV